MKRGFSLIELVIFVAVFGIFFMSIGSVAISTLRNSRIAQETIVATRLAQEGMDYLEALKQEDWNNMVELKDITNADTLRPCVTDPQELRGYCLVPTSSTDSSIQPINSITCDHINCMNRCQFTKTVNKTNIQFARTACVLKTSDNAADNTKPIPVTVSVYWRTMGADKIVQITKEFSPLER